MFNEMKSRLSGLNTMQSSSSGKSRLTSGKKINIKSFFIFVSLIFLCTLSNAQWIPTSTGLPGGCSINAFAVVGSNIFAGTNYFGLGLYASNNDGSTWGLSNNGLGDASVRSLTVNGTSIFAGTNGYGIFISNNGGTSWSVISNGLPGALIGPIAVNGTSIFASLLNYGLYVTSNNGTNWTLLSNGLPAGASYYSILIYGSSIFAGSTGYGIYKSTNNGSNWTASNNGFPTNNNSVNSLAVIGSNIFAATSDFGIFLSTNNGSSWTAVNNGLPPINNTTFMSLAVSGTNIFVGTAYGFGVYLSGNNGTSWAAVNTGFPNNAVPSLAIKGGYIFAGTQGNTVWRRNLSEIVGINSISNNTPFLYSLNQNYPNPFNPTTNIQFAIRKTSDVKLVVYDMSAREIETLVDGQLNAGTYKVDWNASKFASGVYFYRITTENFTETKRMILIK